MLQISSLDFDVSLDFTQMQRHKTSKLQKIYIYSAQNFNSLLTYLLIQNGKKILIKIKEKKKTQSCSVSAHCLSQQFLPAPSSCTYSIVSEARTTLYIGRFRNPGWMITQPNDNDDDYNGSDDDDDDDEGEMMMMMMMMTTMIKILRRDDDDDDGN